MGNGFAPRAADDPQRRQKDRSGIAPTSLGADPVLESGDKPALSAHPSGEPWHPWTTQWWATLQAAPQSDVWTSTDWAMLQETALLYNAFVQGGYGHAAEIRLRLSQLGYTMVDRLKLRMTVRGANPAMASHPATAPSAGTASAPARPRRTRTATHLTEVPPPP